MKWFFTLSSTFTNGTNKITQTFAVTYLWLIRIDAFMFKIG